MECRVKLDLRWEVNAHASKLRCTLTLQVVRVKKAWDDFAVFTAMRDFSLDSRLRGNDILVAWSASHFVKINIQDDRVLFNIT